MREAWQARAKRPVGAGTLVERPRGRLPEMESTKQLVSLLSECYRGGDRILDVGCNTGHYLRGVRRLDPRAACVGVDDTRVASTRRARSSPTTRTRGSRSRTSDDAAQVRAVGLTRRPVAAARLIASATRSVASPSPTGQRGDPPRSAARTKSSTSAA